MTDTVVSRPGGRSARVRANVHRAALELLGERSWSEITMSDIAERADVHPATVYRRWRTLAGLIMDVVAELWERLNPVPDTGSLKGDLELFSRHTAAYARVLVDRLLQQPPEEPDKRGIGR